MSLGTGAAVGLGEAASLLNNVGQQVRTNTDALQVLLSQASTGKNPMFKINPPDQNDPSAYAEDDEAIARGTAAAFTKLMEAMTNDLRDVRDQAAQKVVDSEADPDFLSAAAPGLAKRLAMTFVDLSRVSGALSLQKDQGHKLLKTSENLMILGRLVHIQAGSALSLEAPIAALQGRLAILRGAQVFIDAGDVLTRADTLLQRLNIYATVSQKHTVLTKDQLVFGSEGDIAMVQKAGVDKLFVLQAAKDATIKALAGKLSLLAGGDIEVLSPGTAKLAGATTQIDGQTVNINGNNINILAAGVVTIDGGGSPAVPSAPSAEEISVPDLGAITPSENDRKPGILFETAYGRNPAGAAPPKLNPSDGFNR